VVQVVEQLPGKCKAPSSNPSTERKKKKKKTLVCIEQNASLVPMEISRVIIGSL
jgi:hypothetical protein